ncbi:TVP38/TMEM64 family protein [Thalassotalea atypica]|uniref:TVP38/TMEM64 family protein n=1 Tax=Thalassotalea atypica TaxID=2054316 RepID=UPI0025738805|nr:VTT domain-containing protein [Thalassotalea atypica]
MGYLILFTALSIGTGIGLPRQIAALTAGYCFDYWIGFSLALSATTLGCFFSYQIAQMALHQRVHRRYPVHTAKVHSFLSTSTFIKALIIRILPLGSNFLTNLIAGATNIPRSPFIIGSCVGFIPQMLLFSLIGSGIEVAQHDQRSLAILLTGVSLILIITLYFRHKKTS